MRQYILFKKLDQCFLSVLSPFSITVCFSRGKLWLFSTSEYHITGRFLSYKSTGKFADSLEKAFTCLRSVKQHRREDNRNHTNCVHIIQSNVSVQKRATMTARSSTWNRHMQVGRYTHVYNALISFLRLISSHE